MINKKDVDIVQWWELLIGSVVMAGFAIVMRLFGWNHHVDVFMDFMYKKIVFSGIIAMSIIMFLGPFPSDNGQKGHWGARGENNRK